MFFFFKQKTAYEMRISDWSSDVCSSDLPNRHHARRNKPWQHLPCSSARVTAPVACRLLQARSAAPRHNTSPISASLSTAWVGGQPCWDRRSCPPAAASFFPFYARVLPLCQTAPHPSYLF